MTIVLDASIVAPMVLGDEPDPPDSIVETMNDASLIAPAHWPLEIVNMLHAAERRRRITRRERNIATAQLQALSVDVRQDTAGRAWTDVSRVADEHGLTIYDAAYLELAIRSAAVLASLDRQLIDAAIRCRVPTITY